MQERFQRIKGKREDDGRILVGDVSSWYAVLAPAATPRAIIERLHQACAAAVTTPDVQSRLVTAGVEIETLTPEQLFAKLSTDYERWGKVVKAASIKPN